MNHWLLTTAYHQSPLTTGQVAHLLARVGEDCRTWLAAELLTLVRGEMPLAQCTIFAYPEGQEPKVLSCSDQARLVQISRISRDYVKRFHSLDGNRQAMLGHRAKYGGARILAQLQSVEDITHREYRRVCYEQPQISQRMALLNHQEEGGGWLSINFYRGREHGNFTQREIEFIESVAPLLIQVTRLHYRAYIEANQMPALLSQRVEQLYPELTRRDRELLRYLLSGLGAEDIAPLMGIQRSSAATYIKRIYRKVGVSGYRELLGLVVRGRWS
ncbi:helix-turn-helix transcriptional regulator [Pseudomonas saxonica]|uniref:LuxR family transcriptional regulator n=1 Tax=Pseudomonas saxonica TaxID=2600598 RepID=A0A5C5PTW3_9PSED|nr:LuxR C-terminal-related transcriptional regulator [Pseudomonas saxonica]TWR85444.1 LuxR family transcriptional regulator [Pseudomonas saxonica]